jgi:hypothetical protein
VGSENRLRCSSYQPRSLRALSRSSPIEIRLCHLKGPHPVDRLGSALSSPICAMQLTSAWSNEHRRPRIRSHYGTSVIDGTYYSYSRSSPPNKKAPATDRGQGSKEKRK